METLSLLTTTSILASLQHFEANGPSDEEKIAFSAGALLALSNSNKSGSGTSSFEENLTKVAGSVVIIDRAFDEIDSSFGILAKVSFVFTYPDLLQYYVDWQGLRARWRSQLSTSIVVAKNLIDVLQRFDRVYLQKIENIQTERDRLDAIQALGEFIDERQDRSDQMSREFLDLKRDIAHFLERFDQWLVGQGWIPSFVATIYKSQIETIRQEIARLTDLINKAKGALAIAGASLYFFDFKDPMASMVVYIYQTQRQEQENSLKNMQQALASVEQQPIMQLKAKMDTWRPDLELLCERLVLFAEIWSSTRSQAVQFRGHIQGGLDAATNMRFRREVQLARSVCTPLAAGLTRYAANLESHIGDLVRDMIQNFEI